MKDVQIATTFVFLLFPLLLASGRQDSTPVDKDEINKKYQEAVRILKGKPNSSEVGSLLVELLALAKAASTLDDHPLQIKILTHAGRLAQALKDPGRMGDIRESINEAKRVQKEYGRAKRHIKVLSGKPDDPKANLEVGKFLCFVKGDWSRGLPHLVKGSDKKLAAIAAEDLTGSDDAVKQADLGEAWFDLNRDRAVSWYRKAWPELKGISKLKVRKALHKAAGLPALYETAGKDRVPVPGWAMMARFVGTSLQEGFARTGKYSVKILPRFPIKRPGQSDLIAFHVPAVPGKKYVMSLWMFSDGNDSGVNATVGFYGPGGKRLDARGLQLCMDMPFWRRI